MRVEWISQSLLGRSSGETELENVLRDTNDADNDWNQGQYNTSSPRGSRP